MQQNLLKKDALISLTRDLCHSCFSGSLEPWFSRHCEDAVYLCAGDPILNGADAIRKYFSSLDGEPVATILSEHYNWLKISDDVDCVYGSLILSEQRREHGAILRFSFIYRMREGEARISQEHFSYEYLQFRTDGTADALHFNMQTIRFVRQLMLSHPLGDRIAVKSERQTVYVNPYLIMYIQSDGKHCELCCVDRVIPCSSSISELAKLLPPYFYSIHRSYIVNTYYVVSLRRFEVELVSGTTLPVPEHQYSKVKNDIRRMLHLETFREE